MNAELKEQLQFIAEFRINTQCYDSCKGYEIGVCYPCAKRGMIAEQYFSKNQEQLKINNKENEIKKIYDEEESCAEYDWPWLC